MICNVTPDEYALLKEAQFDAVDLNGRFNDAEFSRMARNICPGLPIAGRFEVIVRRDVQSIPWLTRGVHRIGPDRDAWA